MDNSKLIELLENKDNIVLRMQQDMKYEYLNGVKLGICPNEYTITINKELLKELVGMLKSI